MRNYTLWALFFLLALRGNKIYAQATVSVPPFPANTANWQWTTGMSYIYADTFVITRATFSQEGYAYYDSVIDMRGLLSTFDVSFDFRVDSGKTVNDTSDGFAFFFLKPAVYSPVSGGGGLGIPVNDTGLVIAFDNHDNDGNYNNPVVSPRMLSGNQYVEGSYNPMLDILEQHYICDRSWHTARITYASGVLKLFIDGSSSPTMAVPCPLNFKGKFGVCGATGTGYSYQAIKNFTINAHVEPPCDTAAAYFTINTSLQVQDSAIKFTNGSYLANGYLWDFGDNSTSTDLNPKHLFGLSGNYNVCLYAYNTLKECGTRYCKKVSAEVDLAYGAPSAFSPNGDGVNDIFYARGRGFKEMNMKIYNRQGRVVFETNDIKKGWDGTYNGHDQPVETYGYVLNITCLDGSIQTAKGNVTLVR